MLRARSTPKAAVAACKGRHGERTKQSQPGSIDYPEMKADRLGVFACRRSHKDSLQEANDVRARRKLCFRTFRDLPKRNSNATHRRRDRERCRSRPSSEMKTITRSQRR